MPPRLLRRPSYRTGCDRCLIIFVVAVAAVEVEWWLARVVEEKNVYVVVVVVGCVGVGIVVVVVVGKM